MISLFTRHLMNNNFTLELRKCAGYGRPSYTEVLRTLTRDEQELKGGRQLINLPPSDANKKKLGFKVCVDGNFKLPDMLEWIFNNVENKWTIDFFVIDSVIYDVFFEDVNDAVFCRMVLP